jgi:tetratricopeptide (TPR) repeat protein
MFGAIVGGLLCFSGAVSAAPLPGTVTPSSPHYDLEEMYTAGDYPALEAAIDERLAASPDADLYWMKARVMFERGELIEKNSGVDKVAYYERMKAMADKGLELRPKDPHILFARGIANARIGTTKGVLSSLFLARTVEADWLAATTAVYASIEGKEALPSDAYLALGIFYRLVPDWWIVQVVAGTRGDLDKSLSFHQKAVALKPSIDALKELGVTQLCIAERREDAAMREAGMASLDRGLAVPARSEKNRIDISHMREIKANPGLACEYSRDGQQDLDEKKLQQK